MTGGYRRQRRIFGVRVELSSSQLIVIDMNIEPALNQAPRACDGDREAVCRLGIYLESIPLEERANAIVFHSRWAEAVGDLTLCKVVTKEF